MKGASASELNSAGRPNEPYTKPTAPPPKLRDADRTATAESSPLPLQNLWFAGGNWLPRFGGVYWGANTHSRPAYAFRREHQKAVAAPVEGPVRFCGHYPARQQTGVARAYCLPEDERSAGSRRLATIAPGTWNYRARYMNQRKTTTKTATAPTRMATRVTSKGRERRAGPRSAPLSATAAVGWSNSRTTGEGITG